MILGGLLAACEYTAGTTGTRTKGKNKLIAKVGLYDADQVDIVKWRLTVC